MFTHYLKIAFRNLWKYKMQSLISIVGLAVGFTCFALSVLWIRYERSYDSFHDGADRLYLVMQKIDVNNYKTIRLTPLQLASYLKEVFPEIEDACNARTYSSLIEVDNIWHIAYSAYADSSFMRMFQIELLSGNLDFLNPGASNVAITDNLSKTLWGDEDPLGKQFKISGREHTVCAVIKGWPNHSNFYFQVLGSSILSESPSYINPVNTLIRLKKGINVTAFKEKIYNHKIEGESIGMKTMGENKTNMFLIPITSLHYEYPPMKVTEIEYKYIFIIALSGGLLILCSLFNYMTLFISRFRIRIKELALRIVNGASGLSLFVLLSVEFVLTLIVSLLLGLLLIHLSLEPFRQLSGVKMDISAVYGESLLYIGSVIFISLLAFFLLVTAFRLQNLNVSISRIRNSVFRKTSVILQLIISIGFVFCTVVIVKQIYFLRYTDIGFDYKNTAEVSISSDMDSELLENRLKQIPEITETLTGHEPVVTGRMSFTIKVEEWEDMPQDNDEISAFILSSSEAYTKFYNFRLAEGEFLNDHSPYEQVMINEAAVKAFGWNQPVGKTLKMGNTTVTVKGVIKDFYYAAPTIPPDPAIFRYNATTSSFKYSALSQASHIIIKYHDGRWNECKKKIEQLIEKEYPNAGFSLYNAEEVYNDKMKSEVVLIKLLLLVSFVCIVISVFGLFSLVSLTCEERRKEIAIRKINGASVQNILAMFFREYFMLLVIGAAIAFPVGYLIMKRWVEQYVKQTPISAWIYLSILLSLVIIIILCVGWRVYKTSRENPAEVVKSE